MVARSERSALAIRLMDFLEGDEREELSAFIQSAIERGEM